MSRGVPGIIKVNGWDVVCFLAGDLDFYNLTHIWKASNECGNAGRSPTAYRKRGTGRQYIASLARKLGVHAETLVYYRAPDEWWATHPVAVDYAGWISPEFRLLVNQAATEWAKQTKAREVERQRAREDGKVDRRHQCDAIKELGIRPPPGMKDGAQFGILTNQTYLGYFRMKASDLRTTLRLKRKDSIRENLEAIHLSGLAASERAAADRMRADRVTDIEPAKKITLRSAEIISEAIRRIQTEDMGQIDSSGGNHP